MATMSPRGGPRKGAGRKPGPPEARRRNRLQVNLTDAEYEALCALANPKTPATYVRRLVVRHLGRSR